MQTLRQIAAALGLPESTLRLYRDEFEEYVPCTGQGRRRRYAEDGSDALRRITDWKKEGWAAGRIREELARERAPRERARRRTTEERLDEALALLTAQAGETAMLRAEVAALRAEMRQLITASRAGAPPHFEDVMAARGV